MVAANAIQMSFRTLELIRRLPAKRFQSTRPANGWKTAVPINPGERVAHLHRIVELGSKPLCRGARGEDEGESSPADRPYIPTSLPSWPTGKNVSRWRCRSISHGPNSSIRRVHFNIEERKVNILGSANAPLAGTAEPR